MRLPFRIARYGDYIVLIWQAAQWRSGLVHKAGHMICRMLFTGLAQDAGYVQISLAVVRPLLYNTPR